MSSPLYRANANLAARRRTPGWPLTKSAPPPPIGTGTITLTNPAAYQVFQRDAADTGNILITGTYTGQGGAIEASWNGGAYKSFGSAPAGGVFGGLLTGQPAGQGTLTVRWRGNAGSAVTVAYVGVGDVFIIAGQSNAVGMTPGNQTYSHASLKACMFGNDYAWKELADPVDSNTNQVDTVSSDSCGGSHYPYLATQHLASQGVPCAFVPCAKGGTTSLQWQPGANHLDRTTLYGSMIYRIRQVGGAKCVLWWQGESDAIQSVTQATYNTRLDAIANTLYADTGLKLMACKLEDLSDAGVWMGDESTINAAITEAWGDNSNILAGPDLSTWTPNGDIHYNSAEATSTIGPAWWAAIKAAFGWDD